MVSYYPKFLQELAQFYIPSVRCDTEYRELGDLDTITQTWRPGMGVLPGLPQHCMLHKWEPVFSCPKTGCLCPWDRHFPLMPRYTPTPTHLKIQSAGVSTGCVYPRMAKNAARHKVVHLLQAL